MLNKIKNGLLKFCTFLGATILLFLVGLITLKCYTSSRIILDNNSALVINFADKYSETKMSSLLDDIIDSSQTSLPDLITAIEIAGADKRIDALVAKIDTSDLSFAQIQEIAQAIKKFKESGKKTYAFSRGFGSMGQGNREYYLASFFDNIYMQPKTDIGITGINIEIPFARKLLDKIGIQPEFYSRYEYKTAMSSFTDKKLSAENKAELQKLEDALFTELQNDITQNRELKEDFVKIVNSAPIRAENGIELNLIDDVMYLSEFDKKLKDEGIKGYVNITDYISTLRPNSGNLPTIAVLTLDGIIISGENHTGLEGEVELGSQSVLSDIEQISNIPNLSAVVIRINSPGGEYNAADEIYFALQKLKKEKNIPLIVSQSSYAASGGYFISLAGDYIFANPTTITGSIGVLGGKFVLQDLWNKLDINWEGVKIGDNADILSINHPFTAKEKQYFNRSLDNVYQDFTQKVVENRHLTKDIDEIARGRIWLGKQAVELGLVDALGGYDEALIKAREMAKNNPQKLPNKLAFFPKERSFEEKLKDLLAPANIYSEKNILNSGVNILKLKLFKRLQYDTVLPPFEIKM